jgi:hypothetical protein
MQNVGKKHQEKDVLLKIVSDIVSSYVVYMRQLQILVMRKSSTIRHKEVQLFQSKNL